MTAKEYLRQAYRLDQQIHSDLDEAKSLKEMAESVSAIQYDLDRVQISRSSDAPFVYALEKLWDLEHKVSTELNLLSDLKDQIHEVIETVQDTDERLVLKYRYVHGMTWDQIGNEMHADRTTIYRWHGRALTHVILPECPISI